MLLGTIAGQTLGSTPTSKVPPPLGAAFDRAAAVVTAAGLPGELVITDAARSARAAAFGLADRARQMPNHVGQRWLWASVTKQVTATLVMQEVAKGRMALDAPIGRYLPDFGGNRAITVRELLQHRSGLPNPSDTPAIDGVPGFYRQTGRGIGDDASAAGFCSGRAKAARGGQWEYNNCDYLVLGAALRAVTGRSYAQLVEKRIARPFGIRTLRLARDGQPRGGAAATGYDANVPVPALNVATGGAAAALTGSAGDLAKFDRGLMTGRLLDPTARATAWAGDPQLGFMALGVWSFSARLKGCAEPVQLVERRGDFGGAQVRNVIAPTLGRAVIFFTNDATAEFGEVWQGKGLTHDLLSAAFCPPSA
ncbi:serine hydrolase domain-containing protein [Sphingomonas sp. XXL09]|uniref:serine hydrolase domain-containing protein n=1 Tax=Sphingomonas sp. XXL09 TaxID=3457787 RepID=UPI00406BB59C